MAEAVLCSVYSAVTVSTLLRRQEGLPVAPLSGKRAKVESSLSNPRVSYFLTDNSLSYSISEDNFRANVPIHQFHQVHQGRA